MRGFRARKLAALVRKFSQARKGQATIAGFLSRRSSYPSAALPELPPRRLHRANAVRNIRADAPVRRGDQTAIGLIFSKQAPPQRVLTLQLTNDHFVIPPGDPDFRVEARGTLPNDATLLGFMPHMHLRGKRFEYNIIRENKDDNSHGQPPYQIEPLLRVNYHFHWQMSYRLAQPRFLKAGTELQAVAWYDNSAKNPHNPDPGAAVRWGEQTYDEMMVGFFDVAVPASVDKWRFFVRPKN